MLSELTPIYFETTLEFVPVEELKFDKQTVRRLFDALADDDLHCYENMHLQGIPFLNRQHDAGESILRVAPLKITVEEQRPRLDENQFATKVAGILKALSRVLEESNRESPPIVIQRCKIQCTAQPHSSLNSIELLAGKVAQVFDKIEPFGRPPAFFGVRFRFPAVQLVGDDDDPDSTPDAQEAEAGEVFEDWVTLRFETYVKDISQVWMEIQTMNVFMETKQIQETEGLTENIHRSYRFLEEKCVAFLNQFDVPNGTSGGEQT